jgi:hypothetical protein
MLSVAGVFLCLALGASPAVSQDAQPGDEEYDNLVKKQKEAEEELKRLEKLMLKIAKKIENKQPENAEKLRDAWKTVRDKLILEDMKQVRKALLDGRRIGPFLKIDRVIKNLLAVLEQLTGNVRERSRQDELDDLDWLIDEIERTEDEQKNLRDRTKEGEEDLAPEQGDLKDKTGKLADKVKSGKHRSLQQSKAGKLLDGARQDMEGAEEKLREDKPGAEDDQEGALDKLDRAKGELVKRRNELEYEQTVAALLNMAGKLRKMLEVQLEINRKTSDFDAKKQQEGLTREELFEVLKLGRTETMLREEALGLVKKLEEEKTHVFAAVLRGIAADMKEAAELLDDQDTGDYTRLVQNEIVAQLTRLVKALEEPPQPQIADPPEPPGGPGPPGPPKDPPLIPPVAELKLLREIECDIYEKTGEIHRAIKQTGGKPNFIQKKMINRLAHMQVRLTEMTRKLRESLERKRN